MSIVSSYKNKVVGKKTVFIGEIGLTGEIRSINNIEKRVKEIEKMGYDQVIGAKKQLNMLSKTSKNLNIKLNGMDTIDQVISYIIN
ncbi:DNA repair protein RadA [compost metagenome]